MKSSGLPFLPGYSFNNNIGRTKFPKMQNLSKLAKDVSYVINRNNNENDYFPSIFPPDEFQRSPNWIMFDGQRLEFKAYFQENLQERPDEPFFIRKVTISYFLEDGTMKISEPPVDNSGVEQGVLVKRHKIPLPNTNSTRFYSIVDLNVGFQVEIYGRVYKIYDCDPFTRRFLTRIGVVVPDMGEVPENHFTKKQQIRNYAKKPSQKIDTLGDFLRYDRQVLRYYGYWDDTDNPNGTIHNLEIHYFLADHTMEVKETSKAVSTDCSWSLKKMRIPKFYQKLNPIGVDDPRTVLNVLGENGRKSYFKLDPLGAAIEPTVEYYKDHDLTIGAHIDVLGREIIIIDMDPFTKEYYKNKYGIENLEPLERPKYANENYLQIPKYIPPYNGFGSYEDSLGNCFSMLPKPRKNDFMKFYHYDRQGFDSNILRFKGRMIDEMPGNDERLFIISFHLTNDTISVFELAKRNSGFPRSLFQQKRRIMLPNQNIFTSEKPRYYESWDFYVGALINMDGFIFKIISADDYTLRYMELNSDKHQKSNINLIMKKLREQVDSRYDEFLEKFNCFITNEHGDTEIISYKDFRETLSDFFSEIFAEQEIITIARHFAHRTKRDLNTRERIRSLIHTELQRFLWDDLERLKETMLCHDRARTNYLPRDVIYKIIRACKLPIDKELLLAMLDRLKKSDDGQIDYKDTLEFLDIRIDPMPLALPTSVQSALELTSEPESNWREQINWKMFVEAIGLKKEDEKIESRAPGL